MNQNNHIFKAGDKVSFTDASHRITTKRHSISYKTVRGTILSINEKNVATLQITRSKTRTCHVGNLSPDGEPSALTKAFLSAVSKEEVKS